MPQDTDEILSRKGQHLYLPRSAQHCAATGSSHQRLHRPRLHDRGRHQLTLRSDDRRSVRGSRRTRLRG